MEEGFARLTEASEEIVSASAAVPAR